MSASGVPLQAADPVSAGPSLLVPHFASPFEILLSASERLETEFVATIVAFPRLLDDVLRVLTAPSIPDRVSGAGIIGGAVLLTFLAVSWLLREKRRQAALERMPFTAILKLTGWDLLPLIAAIVVARLLVVRWFGFTPGAAVFPVEFATGLIQWLSALTFLGIVFRPEIPQLRLIGIDEEGASRAIGHGGAILALGYLQHVLLSAGQRGGMPLDTVRLVAFLVSCGMIFATFHLLHLLRQHGLKKPLHLLGVWLVILTFALWVWGWVSQDFDLYRGVKGTIAALLVALAFDRALALSITLSRRPGMMRMFFVVRVVVDSVAIAIILRVIAEYWLVGTFALVPPADWPLFSRRLTFASLVLVAAAWLAATTHVWIEARMTLPALLESAEEKETRQARLSTVLPIIRVTMLVLIAAVFSLIALSALGVDITPVMAGAGILGLAISLGSQALVKDIVSGIFCMLDDVFRLGELIEIGTTRGRVEQIKLRSLRLRGEDDRLHTIPFGEIATVTSHSRRLANVTATIPLDQEADRQTLDRFGRIGSAALHSEAAIQAAIVGKIVARAATGDNEHAPHLILSFHMSRAAAVRWKGAITNLVEEAAQDAGFKGSAGAVKVSLSDVREASSAFLSPPPQPSTP